MKTLAHVLMKALLIFVWVGQLASVGVAGFVLVTGFASASGAPQEAVVAALACAIAILPYCFARGLTEIMATFRIPAPEPEIAEDRPAIDPTRATLGLG